MPSNVIAVILAGGEGRRLGGVDKALVTLGDRRLIDHVYGAIKDQVSACALSVRGSPPWAVEFGLTELEDRPAPGLGPLGGIAAALIWGSRQHEKADWVLTVPVDVPFLPQDLTARLTAHDADVAVAASQGRVHHTIAAWRPALADSLVTVLADTGLADTALAVRAYQDSVETVTVEWPTQDHDPFMNVNTPGDLALAQHVLSR